MKKMLISACIVLLVLVLAAGVAYAADGNQVAPGALRGRLAYGQVTSVGTDQFEVQTGRVGTFTYLVDANTRFRSQNIEDPGIEDLEAGQKVAVASKRAEEGLVARVVVFVPENFDPSKRFEVRTRGEISDIDLAAGALSLTKPSGDEVTFVVDENTRFMGQAAFLDELDIGWMVGIAGSEQEDGSLLAALIISTERQRRIKAAGTVTDVDIEAESFSMTTRQGEEHIFGVNENTKFRSREGEVESLADVQPDMIVIVVGKLQPDGNYLATQVAAGLKENLPNYDLKTGGTITAIGPDSLTIQSKDGDQITLMVSDETRFRSRGLEIHALDDLETGLIVLVGGQELENGDVLAKLVVAVQAP